MKKTDTEQELKALFGQNLAESDLINQKIQEAYTLIRETAPKRKTLGKFGITMTGVAAALVLGIIFCAANPVLAARIPIIGRIFQIEEEKVSYSGDYSAKAQKLITPEESAVPDKEAQSPKENPYRQTSNGITFSISECYADSMAMYLAVSLEAENGFPQTFLEVNEGWDLSYQILEMNTTACADFGSSVPGKLYFDPAQGVVSPYFIEGNFLDSGSFAGIIRISLADMAGLDASGSLQKLTALPEHFIYELNISDFYVVKPETLSYSNDPATLETVSGDWSFSIDVTVDDSEVVTKELNLTNDSGIGIRSVRKSPYEITADLLLPEGQSAAEYVIVMADAAGERLDSRGNTVGTYSTYKRDTGKVTLAVCEESVFLDHKGDFDTLLSKAVFKTEVSFSE